jgi:hypothetical protein
MSRGNCFVAGSHRDSAADDRSTQPTVEPPQYCYFCQLHRVKTWDTISTLCEGVPRSYAIAKCGIKSLEQSSFCGNWKKETREDES